MDKGGRQSLLFMSGQGPQRERPPRGKLTPDDKGPGRELLDDLRRLWTSDDPKVAVPRDVGISVGLILLVLASLWGYTGQPFPGSSPMVVVESGSMMHPEAPYGRVGTIDPGDLVLVKDTDTRQVLDTAYDPGGERTGYGGHGEVIVFRPHGRLDRTPIIHRAMTWVDAIPTGETTDDGQEVFRYDYYDARGRFQAAQESVELPEIGISGFRPDESGYVTRGDNPATNRVADQVSLVKDELIRPDWIIGTARGEIPWLGLVKLGIAGNDRPSNTEGWCQVGAAWSPCDTWVMLGTTAGVMVAVPLTLDMVTRLRRRGGGRWAR